MTKVLLFLLLVCLDFKNGLFVLLPCLDEYPINTTIKNLTEKVSISSINLSNKTNYTINVTYSWNVDVPTGERLDGLLYCMKDVDSVSLVLRDDDLSSVHEISNEEKQNNYGGRGGEGDYGPEYFYRFENNINSSTNPALSTEIHLLMSSCKEYFNKRHWVELDNGTYHQCKFPCPSLVTGTCTNIRNSVCSKITEHCRPISKHRTNLTFPIKFGRRYEFAIIPYVGQYAKIINDDKKIDKVLIFCNEHLVFSQNQSIEDSFAFCSVEQNISAFSTSAAPPLNLTVKVFHNYDNNKAILKIRWRAPLDIALNRTIAGFFVRAISQNENSQKGSRMLAKSKEEERLNPYYDVTITDVDLNQTTEVLVSVFVNKTEGDCPNDMRCTPHSDVARLDIFIPAYNVCALPLNHTSYCDLNATCISLPSTASKPAECNCSTGYSGNGINPLLKFGEGCMNFDACKSETANSCVAVAICVDEDPPSMEVRSCTCRNGFEGDGLKSGTGCRFGTGLIVLAVVIPLLAIAVFCAMSFIIWKYKLYKKRELDKHFSRFVGSNSSTYITPMTVYSNSLVCDYSNVNQMRQAEPVFGHKLEVSRAAIVRQGIIGRGNYGVVHKATITINGEESTVAVKSLTGAYTTNRREDFLAEISLLLTLGSHDNILGVIGVCTIQSAGATDDASSPLLITEYLSYGDLLHFLWDSREASRRELNPIYDFTEVSLYKISRQVAHGLRFLSKQKIIHGDVAARNMLVGNDLQIKISDFGLANDVYRYGLIKGATERRVPFKWVSPERMMGGKTPITWRSDVWSFGILLYEMVTLGAAPYPGMDPMTIFCKLRSGYRMPQPASCSNYLYELMNDCWQWEATRRPGFKELEEKFSDLLYLQDNENSQNLFTKIQVSDEVNESLYESDIGRRDNITIHMNKNETTLHSQENGVRLQNGFSSINNGFAESLDSSVEVTSNGTNGLQRESVTSDDTHFLWAGDITVDSGDCVTTSNQTNGYA